VSLERRARRHRAGLEDASDDSEGDSGDFLD
jgi:hypothetical protein